MIRYFNPGHEVAVLNGSKFYMPPANVVNMQRNLAFLPAYYSSVNDFIFVEDMPDSSFIRYLNDELGICVHVFNEASLIDSLNRPIGLDVDFWGITPQAIHKFETFSLKYELNLSLPQWDERYKQLSHRQASYMCLKYLLDNSNHYSNDVLPRFFNELEEIEKYVEVNSNTKFLLKAPFSSSGRGLLWLPLGHLTRTEKQIIHGHLKKQGCVSIEKVLNKKLDFAMEFRCEDSDVNFIGFSLFRTNNKGAYISNYIGSQCKIKETITDYINPELLEETKTLLTDYLQNNIAAFYNGCIGVDMMVYEENGEYKLQPCVEINARHTMGILALNITERLTAENSEGYFYIDFNPGENSIFELHKEMIRKYPLIVENKKIKSGYFSLCPVIPKTKYRAYLIIND